MNTKDVLQKIGISQATLTRWIAEGKFLPPPKKTTRNHEYNWSERHIEILKEIKNKKKLK